VGLLSNPHCVELGLEGVPIDYPRGCKVSLIKLFIVLSFARQAFGKF
jgi:hypothetical protein